MSQHSAVPKAIGAAAFLGSDFVMGVVDSRDEAGCPLVRIEGTEKLVRAEILDHLADSLDQQARELPAEALIVLPRNEPGRPIVIGFVAAVKARRDSGRGVVSTDEKDVVIDGRRLILEGDREVVLRCGKSSVTLRKDGKIVIKGRDVVSRASRNNKVKGASVNIN